jgi:hypothetical protein
VEDSIFWSNLEHAITFLQPFSDFIHQIEADRPALGRCYEGLMVLDKHVRNAIETMRADPQLASDADRVLSTWQRRLDNMHSSAVQPLLNPAYIAAYLLDPLYSGASGGKAEVPYIPHQHETAAKELIKRVGGTDAVRELQQLLLSGWPASMQDAVHACMSEPTAPEGPTGRGGAIKRKRERVADVAMRKGVWKRYGKQTFPHLSKVAVRLLSMLPTSCASERNWSLWGRVYTAARNRLGLERAKKLIMFCFNDRARVVDQSDFKLLLSVVEGEFAEASAEDDVRAGDDGADTDGTV